MLQPLPSSQLADLNPSHGSHLHYMPFDLLVSKLNTFINAPTLLLTCLLSSLFATTIINLFSRLKGVTDRRGWLVAQHSGYRSFPDLRPIYSWQVTSLWVDCPLWVSQPGQLRLPSLWGQ